MTTERVPTRLIVRESCGCQPYSAPIAGAHEPAAPACGATAVFDRQGLIQAMSEAVFAEARYSSLALIGDWCQSLVRALLDSLDSGDPQPFAAALDQLLQDVEAALEDAYPWQAAMSVLRQQADALCAAQATAASRSIVEGLIDQARVRISERLRRQHTRFLVRQAELIDQLGMMTARLLTAFEPRHILDILDEHLPRIGIRHAHIALFEAQDEDSAAWSNLYIRTASESPTRRRFPSREFPPPGLYDPAEPFRLALLPLIVEDGPAGFVAFDAAYLEPCGLIVRHLAAAFRSSQLHAVAEEGRWLAEEANRLKSRFLSTVSHELRTPLNRIVGLSEMLLRERDGALTFSGAALQDLERIYVNAQHLGRLVGDVLDLASSEAGQLRLYQEPLDLAEVLQAVVATGAQMAHEKGLAWRVQLPPAGAWVRGDRTRLRQVALNLVGNAVKFTERGSVTLELSIADDSVRVSIIDAGRACRSPISGASSMSSIRRNERPIAHTAALAWA